MSRSCDAVVIGAGVIGSAVAFELAKTGRKVIVVDKAAGPGQGSTSASSAVIRFNYSTFDAVALAWESFQGWLNWPKHVGAPQSETLIQVHNIGVAMIEVPAINMPRTAELFEQAGISYDVLDSEGLRKLIPSIDTGRYWPPKRIDDKQFWDESTETVRAMYTPDGGYINDPKLAAENLAAAAQREGVQFVFRSEVVEVLRDKNRVHGVVLDSGETITAQVVVNVAGPWSGHVNNLAGVGEDFTITLRPMRQEVHHASAPASLINPPIIGDLDTGVYIRPEVGHSLLIGGTEPECDLYQWVDDPDVANMNRTQELFEAQVTRAARRLPDLQVPSSASGVVGIYDVSSDWSPIYDKTSLDGFYLAAGSSGNQFKNAPGAGRIMAHLINEVEAGVNHDDEPVHYVGPYTGLRINLGTFSRKRAENENSTGTVMG